MSEEELIEELENGKISFRDIPQEKLTYKISLFAMQDDMWPSRDDVEHIPEHFKTYEIYLLIGGWYIKKLGLIPNEYKTREFYLNIIGECSLKNINYILSEVGEDKTSYNEYLELVRDCLNKINHVLLDIPGNIKTYEFYLEVVKKSIIEMKYIPEQFRTETLYFEMAKANKKERITAEYIPHKYVIRYNPITLYVGLHPKTPFIIQQPGKMQIIPKKKWPRYDEDYDVFYHHYLDCEIIGEYFRVVLFIKN